MSFTSPIFEALLDHVSEFFGVLGDLKSITGVISRQIRDQDERLSCSLLVVVDGDLVYLDFWRAAFSFLNQLS